MLFAHPIPGPNYYLAIFGDPEGIPKKDRVEDGRYIPGKCPWPGGIAIGDIVLLYCTGSYIGHFMEAPGIGVVLEADKNANVIQYRYLEFTTPISSSAIEAGLQSPDLQKFKLRRFSTFWIFDITRQSFQSVVGASTFIWR
jgi:hypothetical protein